LRRGFQAAQVALAKTPEPTDSSSTLSYVLRSVTYVELALELGKLSVARERAKACIQHALRIDSPRASTLAETVRGLCEVHGGNTERGLKILEEILVKTSVQVCKPLILIALVKAYDVASRPEMALKHMKALLDHVKDARSKAVATFLTEGGQVGDESLSAMYLREARLEARVAEREILVQQFEMLERLAVTADIKEEQSGEHGYRVGRLSCLVFFDMGWSQDDSSALESAARLHDIGKIAMPDRILLSSKSCRKRNDTSCRRIRQSAPKCSGAAVTST
jgi:putative two-component system response regulator